MPGDAILCDDSGVAILSIDSAKAEIQRALDRQERERNVLSGLRNGLSLAEISGASKISESETAVELERRRDYEIEWDIGL